MMDHKTASRRFLSISILVIVSACSTTATKPPPPLLAIEIPSPSAPAVSIPAPESALISELPSQQVVNPALVPISPSIIATKRQSSAIVALLYSADTAQQQGDFKSAQSTLQRAQRIAPRDPEVYYKLAVTHRNLEDYRLAEQVALKGVSIVQGQPSQLRRFWLLIADIRMQSGDVVAAEKAEITANRY
ncbi:MAG: tetratricopeptide (TPR) repeat protein [Methylophagaceae bacterium]|jgi:tetratricopeptide (TPR) repeat protein